MAKYGPIIKRTDGDKTLFIPVKSDIDIDKLRRGEYKLNEIILSEKSIIQNLGLYKDEMVVIKNGKYGLYVEHGKIKKSLNNYNGPNNYNGTNSDASSYNANSTNNCDVENITLDEIIKFLYSSNSTEDKTISSSIIRKIDDNTSIRTGKYGDYIYHKKPKWTKPSFLKLSEFINEYGKDSYKTCDLTIITKWIFDTYKI